MANARLLALPRGAIHGGHAGCRRCVIGALLVARGGPRHGQDSERALPVITAHEDFTEGVVAAG
eukprot:7634705-Pyramimonas_sp.AAC.1